MLKHLVLIAFLFFACKANAQYGWTEAEVYLKEGKLIKGLASIPMENADYSTFGKSKENLKFKTVKKAKSQKFKAEQIDSIIFTIKYDEKVDKKKVEKTRQAKYIPVFLDKKKKKQGFAELIVNGKIKLVGRTVSYSSSQMVHGPQSIGTNGDMIYLPPVYQQYSGLHNTLLLVRDGYNAIKINQVSLFKAFRKRASEFFGDCPTLVSKIESKEFKKEDLIAIVEYYNSNCAK